jgi:hypothetical protein
MLLSKSASQMVVPAGAVTVAPLGQYSAWGRMVMMAMVIILK